MKKKTKEIQSSLNNRPVLIRISFALSQTPVYTARKEIQG